MEITLEKKRVTLSLKAARVNCELTLREAADKLGVHVDTLGNYESKRTTPKYDIIVKMCHLYGVNLDDLRI